jgi:hypothetical protein
VRAYFATTREQLAALLCLELLIAWVSQACSVCESKRVVGREVKVKHEKQSKVLNSGEVEEA